MSKLFSMSGACVLAMGFCVQGWAANPCLPIAQACMQQGYYKGGNKVGKGLVDNCVMPIATKKKTLPNTTFSDAVLEQCQAALEAKLQQKNPQ
jgi:hypothetical protein